MVKAKSNIKDIFNGEYLDIWEDEYFVWISMPFVSINISKDEWQIIKKDFLKVGEL